MFEQTAGMRIDMTNQVYDQSWQLELNVSAPKKPFVDYTTRVTNFINTMLENDIGEGDLTTKLVTNPNQEATAIISTEENGVVAGIEEVVNYYETHGVKAVPKAEDGDVVEKDQELIYLEGKAQSLLTLERVGLNIIRRMSGIATLTREYVNLLEPYNTQVAGTRKTNSEELLEKKAIYHGGGLTHRLGLDQHIMIKDCHLDLIAAEGYEHPITEAVNRAEEVHYNTIEVEVKNIGEAVEAAKAIYSGFDIDKRYVIMLDNMQPIEITDTLEALGNLTRGIIFEASGGINLDTAESYAKTGVDVVSTSQITERAMPLNIHQKIKIK